MSTRIDPTDRLLQRVNVTDGCWEWTGARLPTGYGHVRWQGKDALTHRLIWALCFGEIPGRLWVLHKCDNPPCCNPDHLFLGTPKNNTHDAISKGRWNIHRNQKRRKYKSAEEAQEARRIWMRDYMREWHKKHKEAKA